MKNSINLLFISLVLASCGTKDEQIIQRPPMPYNVIEARKINTTLFSEYPANIEGEVDVDVRSKIDGYISEVYVIEGQNVSAGQVLFKIDNPLYSQEASSLKAAILSSKAAVATAELQVEKTKPLVSKGIVSSFELKNAELALESRKAELEQAKAKYNNAITNINYTTIKSPIKGIVGRIQFKKGSYVSSQTTTPLTRISATENVYAYFSMNEKEQLDLIQNVSGKNFEEKIKTIPPVNLIMSNKTLFKNTGKIESFSGQINTSTGSFNVRAKFSNTDKILTSGASATIQIPSDVKGVIVIPQKASLEMQDKRLVYIIDKDNTVKGVPVSVRAIPGGQYFIVDKGINEGDKILIEGIGIINEGTKIKPIVTKIKI